MNKYIHSFNEFLNESQLFEGTLRTDKRLDDKEQKEFNKLKMKFLKKQIQLCNKHNVKCFLDYGSLLGMYRDGEMIKNDNDTDLAIYGETVTKEFLEDVEKEFILQQPKNMSTLINKLFKEDKSADDYHQIPYIGLKLKGKDGKPETVTSIKGKTVEVGGDFFFYYPYTAKKRVTRWPGWEVQLTPQKHFERLGTITSGGFDYPIPSSPDEYLEYIYGKDWKTPKSNAGVNQKLEFISREEGHNYVYSHNKKKFKK